MKAGYLIATVALSMLLVAASAAQPSSSLKSFLSAYMSNGTISQFSYYNLTLAGTGYVVAAASNGTYLTIVNNAGSYTLLTDVNTINPVLTSYFMQYENLSAVSYLNTAMQSYYNQVKSNLTDCVDETGANPATASNYTVVLMECQSEPNCNRALAAFGPYSVYGANSKESAFGSGLQNFSISYGIINNSFNSYFSTVHSLNASNAGTKVAALGTYISNISSTSSKLLINPLFPPPANANFASCNSDGLSSQEPWYCVAVGYCENLQFNSSLLSSISSAQQALVQSIPSGSRVMTYSASSATAARGFVAYANAKANAPAFNAFLNKTYPTYNSTVAAISALIAKAPNANLSASLSKLKSSFSAILSNGVNVSIANESSSFNAIFSSVLSTYNQANLSFAQASIYSNNYTLTAISAQLNYRKVPPKLATLSSQLAALDLKVGAGANSATVGEMLPNLKIIGLQLAVFVPITTVGYLIKMADGWFINAMLASSNISVPAKIAAAPMYAAILSFIIGMVIFALIYLGTYGRFSRKHKLRHNRKASMAWMALFIVIFILVLLYTYLTYAYANAATNFLPFSYFTSSLHGSKTAYLVLNGSATYSNSAITQCASALSAALISQGKSVKTIEATNYSCVAAGTVSPLGIDCIDQALSKGTPVVAFSQSGSGIVYKGLYGTILYVGGANATGSSCIVAQLLSRK